VSDAGMRMRHIDRVISDAIHGPGINAFIAQRILDPVCRVWLDVLELPLTSASAVIEQRAYTALANVSNLCGCWEKMATAVNQLRKLKGY